MDIHRRGAGRFRGHGVDREDQVEGKKRGRGGAQCFGRRALLRRYRAGMMATPTTATCISKMPSGVRLKPVVRLGLKDSAFIAGSWTIDRPAG
jgi:hypothetical protein